jgi:hypothetical protein
MSVALLVHPPASTSPPSAVVDASTATPALPLPVGPRLGRSLSPLQLIANRFALLDGDGAYRVDGASVAGLPDRLLGLSEPGTRHSAGCCAGTATAAVTPRVTGL